METTFWARTDSNNANNPALNLTGDPAVQITLVPTGPNGDLFLEYANGGVDPDTQVSIGGTSYNFTFELSATLPVLKKNGAGQVPDQFEGSTVYLITVQNYPTPGTTTRLTFMPDETATQAEMNAFGNGAISLQNLDTTTTGAVCFAEGTHILTPKGEVAVEYLEVGDLVTTLDHGEQPIRWISTSAHAWPGSSKNELPVLVSKNALGPGLPHRRLVISPQHKILISDHDVQSGASGDQALAPAKGLTSQPGIRHMKGMRAVVYYHILFDAHEILLSEGLETESFFPGPAALKMLSSVQREQIFSLFPELKEHPEQGYGPRARRSLTVAQSRRLADRRKLRTPAPRDTHADVAA